MEIARHLKDLCDAFRTDPDVRWYGDDVRGVLVEHPSCQVIGRYEYHGSRLYEISGRLPYWSARRLAREEEGEWGFWGPRKPLTALRNFPYAWVRFVRSDCEFDASVPLEILLSIGIPENCRFERDEHGE